MPNKASHVLALRPVRLRGWFDSNRQLILIVTAFLKRFAIVSAKSYLWAMPTGNRDDLNLQEAFEYGRSALQILVGINGGAAAAILAFYGSAVGSGRLSAVSKGAMADALAAYVVGVSLAAAAFLIGYLAQLGWGASHNSDKITNRWENAAAWLQSAGLLIALCSLAAFVVGCLSARRAILG